MKNLIWIICLSLSFLACKTTKTDYTKLDLNSIELYDINNLNISTAFITKHWNKRLQEDEDINAKIERLNIINLIDIKTNKKTLVLLGTTNQKSVKTATKLTAYKDGLKLSNITVTCTNCDSDLNLQLNNKDWSCISDDNKNNTCTKTVTLVTE